MIGKYVYKACETLIDPEATGPVLEFLRQKGKK